jgi:hypothetical protein
MTIPNNRIATRSPSPATPAGPAQPAHEPIYCIIGNTLCQVRVWTEEEWEKLDPAERPSPAEHVPGLGWVGAVLRSSPK